MESNWQKFVLLGEENVSVRKPVWESWNRSKQFGVSHEENKDLLFINKQEMEERVQANRTLLNVSSPIINDLYGKLKGGGYQITLTDVDGYFLKILADRKVEALSGKIGTSVGVRWLEKDVGTTGLTIALNTHSAMVTSGAEHFCVMLWNWDCAAAPIIVDNKFLGVLNICRITRGGDGLEEHLSLAVSTANSISQRIKIEYMQMKERTMLDLLSLSETKKGSPGILAFNNQLGLVYCNEAATEFVEHLKRERTASDLLLTDPNQLMNSKAFHTKDQKNAHFVFNDSKNEFYIELKECKSGEELTSTLLFVHPKSKSAGNVAYKEASPILSSFPTKEEGFKKTLKNAVKVAKSDNCFLLQGESGTGKDFMARSIHKESGRGNQPFIAINCSALPRELISSELFGHSPGAFTGANRNGSPGKLEAANGGTLFLDEIGDMPIELQGVLLRTLEEKQITRIGSTKSIPVDVRFIAATHKNLKELVKSGEFREDLYYRLSVFTISLPSLRERMVDLEEIVNSIGLDIFKKAGRPSISFTPQAIKRLQNYHWKGNLRELRNFLERAALLHDGDIIDIQHIGNYLDLTQTDTSLDDKELLLTVLDQTLGNRAKAARELGISRAALYRKLERYGL
ncbi:sigma-54-dependent Fis family transcriptional regulator [Mesobacillus harenae]|uniref:sigma-54-dependent Fis family transcriptional regulator n=1 Tax=Mesobacillus harenae TaxID=2213203 RepID=UPI001F55A397|nr:sigma-54-dependent Fis family transcriptional regulator [Mesobacillus harenae]